MKRFITLVLAALMAFSLVSCGNSEELEKYRKYETLINYLEASDYKSAYAEMMRMYKEGGNDSAGNESASETTSPLPVAVEITSENWQDYFEIVKKEQIVYNDFNEIEDMYIDHVLALKDGYEIVGYDTSIAVEYNYKVEWRYVEIDKEAGKLTVGELVPDKTVEENPGVTITVTGAEYDLTPGRTWSEGMQAVPTDFEIVRMQGTLYIAA